MTQRNAAVVDLVTQDAADVPQRAEAGAGLAIMLERLAANPNVDIDKFERLMAMQERVIAYTAKQEYFTAFAAMQGDIPSIVERGRTDKGSYAKNDDIQEIVRPILQKHGFMLSFRTEFPDKTTVKVIGVLAHRGGHFEQTEFLSAADTSGSKNAIQALGSAQSYGQRYTTKALLNITSHQDDDDGERTSRAGKPDVKAPEGYDAWLATLDGLALDGMKVFAPAWNQSPADFRRHLTATAPKHLAALKTKAGSVK